MYEHCISFFNSKVSRLEEIRKKNMKDLEELNHKLDEVQGANEKLEKSKRKLAAELDDATHELDSHRAKVLDLEKKQRNFDKILAEEKLNADRYVTIEASLLVAGGLGS